MSSKFVPARFLRTLSLAGAFVALVAASPAMAEAPVRMVKGAEPTTGLGERVLPDEALAGIRGMGSESGIPEIRGRVGVILWDEGSGPRRATAHNRADGLGNEQINRARIRGR